MWTETRAVIKVPVTPEVRDYRLVLEAADGSPGGNRPVRVTCGGKTETVNLPQVRGAVDLAMPVDATESGLADLVFAIAPWRPGEEEGIDDPRSLGFLFYRLTWGPAEGPAAPP